MQEAHIYRFAALGGKRLPSERWIDCALREAREETSGSINIVPAPQSVYFDLSKKLNPARINEDPHPLAVIETADESIGVKSGWGKRYTVVYLGSFDGQMRNRSEVRGFLKVTNELLLKMAQTEMTFEEFIRQGGEFSGNKLPKDSILKPYGAAELVAAALKSQPDLLSPLELNDGKVS